VLDDVDPKETAPQIYGAAMQNAGQVCIAAKRIYVHESMYDAMCDELVKCANEAWSATAWNRAPRWGRCRTSQFDKVLGFLGERQERRQHHRRRRAQGRQGYFINPPSCATSPRARNWSTRSSSAR
jgi:acyl-CoA reductase-like NAD-dependent aldehyde dehydrogenase